MIQTTKMKKTKKTITKRKARIDTLKINKLLWNLLTILKIILETTIMMKKKKKMMKHTILKKKKLWNLLKLFPNNDINRRGSFGQITSIGLGSTSKIMH